MSVLSKVALSDDDGSVFVVPWSSDFLSIESAISVPHRLEQVATGLDGPSVPLQGGCSTEVRDDLLMTKSAPVGQSLP